MPYPWSAGNVLTATDLNSSLAAKTDTAMTQNAQTGTSYSYVLLDASKLLTMNNAASNTVTVTKQATVAWVTGTQLRVMNLGAGVTTLVGDTGVTINGNVSLSQYQGGTLIRTASDVWLFVPTASAAGMDLVASASLSGSSVLVTSCFSAKYDNYQIVCEATMSANNDVWMRLLVGSTPNTAANYEYQFFRGGVGTTTLANRATAQTSWPLTTDGQSTGPMGTITIYKPFLAVATRQLILSAHASSQVSIQGQLHTTSTSFDGIQFLPAAGTFTSGTVKIYGLRNS